MVLADTAEFSPLAALNGINISGIAHCNGVISERGEDKGVRRDISKHRPTATADVRPREA